jgi:hypothetical protein
MKELTMEEHKCRVCRRTLKPAARADGAQWLLCARHAAAVVESVEHQRIIRELREMVARKQLALVADAAGAWLAPIRPAPPKPQPVMYADDGTPRFRDMSNRLGVTLLPGDDLFDGDERQ